MIRNRTAHASTRSITLMVARTQAHETAHNLFGLEIDEIQELDLISLVGLPKSYRNTQSFD